MEMGNPDPDGPRASVAPTGATPELLGSTPIVANLRCWPVRTKKPRARAYKHRIPNDVLYLVDVETTPDPSQRLTFGSARRLELRGEWRITLKTLADGTERRCRSWSGVDPTKPGAYDTADEVLFHADDAPPEFVERLKAYARSRDAEIADPDQNGRRPLRVLSQHQFLHGPFYRAVYKDRALLANLNLPIRHLAPRV